MSGTQTDRLQCDTPIAATDRSVRFADLVDARNPTAPVRNPYHSLNTASRILGFAALVVAIVGIMSGTFFATIGGRSADSTPYLVVGIGLAIYKLVFAAILYWMSSFGMAWANKNDPLG